MNAACSAAASREQSGIKPVDFSPVGTYGQPPRDCQVAARWTKPEANESHIRGAAQSTTPDQAFRLIGVGIRLRSLA